MNTHPARADLKLGIIGIDTSHAIEFTRLLNDAGAPGHVPGARVVSAYKSYSADIPQSAGRVEQYTAQFQNEFGVRLEPSIEALCQNVDAVLIENVDGRAHLEAARMVIAAKKRCFVDKPVGGTLRDTIEIFRLAEDAGVPIFSSSAYRFYGSLLEVKGADIGEVRSAISYGPAHLEEHHPDLFYYGIHPTEALFTVMGRGCESVVRTHTADTDVATGLWSGGRVGVLFGIRTKPLPHKVTVFGSAGFSEQKQADETYAPLVAQIVRFFETGIAPVSAEETIEIYAFMEAADESKRRGGCPVALNEVLEKARMRA